MRVGIGWGFVSGVRVGIGGDGWYRGWGCVSGVRVCIRGEGLYQGWGLVSGGGLYQG